MFDSGIGLPILNVSEEVMPDKKKVLVVDDMVQNRTAIKAFLFFLHFDSVLAEDGLEAKKLLETEQFDLIVSDIEMPNMNGFELLAFIKKSEKYKSLPVVMLSSLESPEVLDRCKKLGAAAYIVKPFTKEKFEAVLSPLGLIT